MSTYSTHGSHYPLSHSSCPTRVGLERMCSPGLSHSGMVIKFVLGEDYFISVLAVFIIVDSFMSVQVCLGPPIDSKPNFLRKKAARYYVCPTCIYICNNC